MSIINAKVSISRFGCTSFSSTGETHRSVMYMPKISIALEGRKSAKTGYLAPDRFGKQNYVGLTICEKFLVICTTAEYITVGEDAQEHASISVSKAGRIISANAQSFLCIKGTTLTAYDFDCIVLGSWELTEEEINRLTTHN